MSAIPPTVDAEPRKKRKPIGRYVVLGLCVGGCVCPLILGMIVLPVFLEARQAARAQICFQRMRIIDSSISEYVASHGVFPDSISQALDDTRYPDSYKLCCPDAREPGPGMGYAYNAAVFAGRGPSQLSPTDLEQPLVIEVNEVKANDNLTSKSMCSRRHGKYVIADFYGRGPIRLMLKPDQLNEPILSIKNLRNQTRGGKTADLY